MTATSEPKKVKVKKDSPPLPVTIILVTCLLTFMSWWAYVNLVAPEPDKETPAGVANDKWIDKIATESGGDVSKLKPDDLEKLNGQTRGHAREMLMGRAKKLGVVK